MHSSLTNQRESNQSGVAVLLTWPSQLHETTGAGQYILSIDKAVILDGQSSLTVKSSSTLVPRWSLNLL